MSWQAGAVESKVQGMPIAKPIMKRNLVQEQTASSSLTQSRLIVRPNGQLDSGGDVIKTPSAK